MDATCSFVEGLVEELLFISKIHGPPVDPVRCCQRLRLELEEVSNMAGNGLTQIGDFIRVKEGLDRDVASAVIGHELGHQSEHRFLKSEFFWTVHEREHLCDLFGVALLTPMKWFAADCRRFDWNLYELKRRYSTAPHWAIAARWLAVTDSPMVVSILDGKGKTLFRQSNGPAAVGWHPVERRAVAEAKRRKRPVRARGDGVTVDVWLLENGGSLLRAASTI